MVDVVDKFPRDMNAIIDFLEDPESFDHIFRDEDGKIIEPKNLLKKDWWVTFEFLMVHHGEREASNRILRSTRLEFVLKYWGTKFAPLILSEHGWAREISDLLNKIAKDDYDAL